MHKLNHWLQSVVPTILSQRKSWSILVTYLVTHSTSQLQEMLDEKTKRKFWYIYCVYMLIRGNNIFSSLNYVILRTENFYILTKFRLLDFIILSHVKTLGFFPPKTFSNNLFVTEATCIVFEMVNLLCLYVRYTSIRTLDDRWFDGSTQTIEVLIKEKQKITNGYPNS